MKRVLILSVLLSVLPLWVFSMELTLPQQQAAKGEIIQLALSAKNFENIVSVQFSLAWNPSVLKYIDFEEAGLKPIGVGTKTADEGELRISWFEIQGQGLNLDDDSPLILLNFEVIGEEGQSTDISFVKEPLDIQIFQGTSTSGVFTEVELTPNAGLVEIVSALSISSEVGQVPCFGASSGSITIELNGTITEYNVNWTGPEGFSSDQLSLNNLSAGDYQLQITDNDGNILLEESFSITSPLAQLALDQIDAQPTGCGEASGQVNFMVSGGTPPYQYDIGDGAVAQQQFNGLAAGSYQIAITDANDCQLLQDFEIDAPNVSPVDLGEDLQLCQNENFQLDAGEHLRYKWSTGSSSASIDVNQAGIYSVTVSDGSACVSSDTIQLLVVPDIQLTVEEEVLQACPGEPTILRVSGGDNYNWLDPTNTLTINDPSQPIAAPEATTNYAVISENECSSDTANIEIQVFEITADAGPDTCLAPGATAQLNATGGQFYEWAEGNYILSNYRVANPTAEVEDSTTFVVLITDENNCQLMDSVTVLIAADPLQFVKRINMITPNGDGKNDVLEFKDIDKYGFNQLTVYNRWGDIMFQKLNYQNDETRFDGTFKGQLLPAGTYYYVLAFREAEIKQALVITYE